MTRDPFPRAASRLLVLAVMLGLPASNVGAQATMRVRGYVVDAATGAPVDAATVAASGRVLARTDAGGRFELTAAGGDSIVVSRLGYRTRAVVPAHDTVTIALAPLAAPLAVVRVEGATQRGGRLVTSITSEPARSGAGSTAGDLVAQAPFVTARSAPGRTVVSVRGARPEQVLVTLDGVPLNDPASGAADLSDIPLAAVGQATIIPGAASAAAAPGATGGVIALSSGDRSRLATSVGSYGARAADATWASHPGDTRIRLGGAWSTARNDFAFRNTAAAPPADTVERRVNDDVARVALFGAALFARAQVVALASRTDRGLVGPINVRAFDRDRGRTRRALARLTTTAGGWTVSVDSRALDNAYHDPAHTASDATVWSVSGDVQAARAVGPMSLLLGAGNDRAGGTLLRGHDRPRASASVATARALGALLFDVSLRADAIRDAGSQLSPSLAVTRPGRISAYARWSQSFRPPSFFDLFLASPQRVTVRSLAPERVVMDAELGASIAGPAQFAGALFARRTRNAIIWFPGNVGWAPTNVPDERVVGGELRASGTAGPVELSAWGAAYHTRLWDGYAATRTPYVPYVEGGARGTLTVSRWTMSADANVVGRRPFVSGPPSPQIELPAATVISAALVRRVDLRGRPFTISLSAQDLGDTHWESVRRYPTPGRTFAAGLTYQP